MAWEVEDCAMAWEVEEAVEEGRAGGPLVNDVEHVVHVLLAVEAAARLRVLVQDYG